MTRNTNARIAGFTFLFYIAVGITGMMLFSQATRADGVAAQLAIIAQHALQLRLGLVSDLLQAVCAIVLAVTLYAITRDQDSDLAMLALTFRVCERLLGAVATRGTLELLWLGTTTGPRGPDVLTRQALGTYLLNGPNSSMPAIFFAMGSTLFSYLLLRGRTIPVPLAWIGVVASVLLACCGSSAATSRVRERFRRGVPVDPNGGFRGATRLLAPHQRRQSPNAWLRST